MSAGEEERLDLVDYLATRIGQGDAGESAVCRRLLEHLRGPRPSQAPNSRLQ